MSLTSGGCDCPQSAGDSGGPISANASLAGRGGPAMMRWLIGSSLKFRLLIIPIAAALMVAGFVQLRRAPVDVLPEFTPPTVQIQTEALGLSAAEVEQLVTVPLEQDLLNV